jgi:hypothetical protein
VNYCSITPDRGDRPHFFEFCIKQLNKVNNGHPTNAYLMNDRPKNGDMDLVPRVRQGIEMAKRDGFEWAFVFESDDCFPSDYFQRYEPHFKKYDFIGDSTTFYYNIKTLRWSSFKHAGRASLFTTAFRISALEDFVWPPDNSKFLDLAIWKFARNKKKVFVNSGAIGIKHGHGLVGGKGHVMKLNNADPERKWLKSRVEDYQFKFYKDLMLTL